MISFNQLGNLGRLGNQMFQYAAIKGIAKNRGYDFIVSPPNYFGMTDPNVRSASDNIYSTFKLESAKQGTQAVRIVKESGFAFDQNLFDACDDNVDLYGYFQSEKYFKHIEDSIRKDFSFLDHIKIPTLEMFDETFGESEVISLHIRRGDYVGNQNHPLQNIEYYKTGLNFFDNDIPVIIFSDDIEWCKEQIIFSGDRFIFSENNNAGTDLMLQSLCKYHIIANSSFSWWGSWLAKSKKVIAPKKWLGRNVNLNDLYCENWIGI